jgi:hypothetical protein
MSKLIDPGEVVHPELIILARRRTAMPRKSYKPEGIVLLFVNVAVAPG